MSERLAIKSDQVEDWCKLKLKPALKTLTPRPSDNGVKSSWAHCAHEGEVPAVLSDPAQAPCRLQALALFFFSERYTRANRNQVTGVSLLRESIDEELIVEDRNDHPIAAYCVTHRSLNMSAEERRLETVSRILTNRAFVSWEYSKYEMAELLRDLLDGGHIEKSMEHDARSLLEQWNS